jgi:hypothetical protein
MRQMLGYCQKDFGCADFDKHVTGETEAELEAAMHAYRMVKNPFTNRTEVTKGQAAKMTGNYCMYNLYPVPPEEMTMD